MEGQMAMVLQQLQILNANFPNRAPAVNNEPNVANQG